jgi:hypothetical protein
MKPKKKSSPSLGLGLDSGLDLAISPFIYSFGCYIARLLPAADNCCVSQTAADILF